MEIKTATAAGVATLEMARPQKKNALTHAMYDAMAQAVSASISTPVRSTISVTALISILCTSTVTSTWSIRPFFLRTRRNWAVVPSSESGVTS